MMEKHTWHRAHLNLISNSQPVPRWGHSCCVIGNEIVYFGGYAESVYMNDVWSFNTTTMEWTQIKTTGDIPSQRSNCTMSYDSENDQVIVFGGGGPNKKRFNTVNILNWMTKEWIEIHPKQNESAPWERTYHVAELFYPYLVVYGGQGVADMDDLWIFNLLTLSWTEVHTNKNSVKPCARRFHSSAKIGNELFIVGGCHGKYRCLSDIFSLDLTPLINGEDHENLVWRDRKPLGSAFLTRWGHSSAVYDRKIYIFGGRFSNDLNDILVFEPNKNSIKALKTSIELPKARRRHSACFVGSCMVVFGGFNGQYYNDLYYINAFELKSRVITPPSSKTQSIMNLLGNSEGSDALIISKEERKIPIHKGLLFNAFNNDRKMTQFIEKIQNQEQEEIIELLEKIYLGYGNITQKQRLKYDIDLPETLQESQEQMLEQLCPQFVAKPFSRQKLGIGKKASKIPITVCLPDEQFSQFLEQSREQIYKDVNIIINKTFVLPSNRAALSLASKFFKNLFSSKYKQFNTIQNEIAQVHITLPEIPYKQAVSLKHSKSLKDLESLTYTPNIVLFQIILNYLLIDKVVIPMHMSAISWFQLYALAQYFCLGRLMSICEKELCMLVDEQNCGQILDHSILSEMEVLSLYCSDYLIKTIINRGGEVFPEIQESENESILNRKKNDILEYMYNLARFDILQVKLERIKLIDDGLQRKQSQSTQDQKQNYQINCNY